MTPPLKASVIVGTSLLGSLGNVRTQTMRASSPEEIRAIVGKMP